MTENLQIKKLKKISTTGLVFLLLLIPTGQTMAQVTTSWEEDFENEEWKKEWVINSWNRGNGGGTAPNTKITQKMTVENGILQNQNFENWFYRTDAIRNSTITNGSWSFDWIVTNPTYFTMAFAGSSDSFDYEGLTEAEFMKNSNFTGSFISIASHTKRTLGAGQNWPHPAPGIAVGNLTHQMVDTHYFSESITGKHKVLIERNENGNLKVSFDKKLVINVTLTQNVPSKYIFISVFRGDSAFDNFQTYNLGETPNSATASIEYEFYIEILSSFVVISILRKKLRK